MPTYEYRCESCGTTVEVVQSFNDAPLTTCASCGGALRKVYAPVGIVFKGSGFYKTDSRTSSSKPAEKKPAGDAAPASTGDAPAPAATKSDGAKQPATASSGGTTAPSAAGSGTSGGGAAGTSPA